MRCPRCREQQDVLAFVPMGMIEEYAEETNPIYKCRMCRWVFSPALRISEMLAMLGIAQPSDDQGERVA